MNVWFETEFHQVGPIAELGSPGSLQSHAIIAYIKKNESDLKQYLIKHTHYSFIVNSILNDIHDTVFNITGALSRNYELDMTKLQKADDVTKTKFILGLNRIDISLGKIARRFLQKLNLNRSTIFFETLYKISVENSLLFDNVIKTKRVVAFLCFTEVNPWSVDIPKTLDGITFNYFLLGWIKIHEGLSELQRKLDLVAILRMAEAVPETDGFNAYDSASFAYLFLEYWQSMELIDLKSEYQNSIQEAVDKKLFMLWQNAAEKIKEKSDKYKRNYKLLEYFTEQQWLCDHMGKTAKELTTEYQTTWDEYNNPDVPTKLNKTYLKSEKGYHHFVTGKDYDDHFKNYIVTKYMTTLVLYDSFQQPSQ